MNNKTINKVCENIVCQNLKIKPDDKVKIISDKNKKSIKIAESFCHAINRINCAFNYTQIENKKHFKFMDRSIAFDFIKNYDVLICILNGEIGINPLSAGKTLKINKFLLLEIISNIKNGFMKNILEYGLFYGKKTRGFYSYKINTSTLIRLTNINQKLMIKNAKKLKSIFDKTRNIKVITKKGTNITFSVKGRKSFLDIGDFSKPKSFGNLPWGEIYISPKLGTTKGVIVADGSFSYLRGSKKIKNPIFLNVDKGFVYEIIGLSEAKILKKSLETIKKFTKKLARMHKITSYQSKKMILNSNNIAEFGIGLNPKARIIGNIMEDEKKLATVHFAIGNNYNWDSNSLCHFDFVIKNPTVYFDSQKIISEGKFIL